jgi:RHS repeat-associated protein
LHQFDSLNRMSSITASNTAGTIFASYRYAYNSANQRSAVTNADSSLWSYGYDLLGQVISGKRYWSDGTVVAGQQFDYAFDDIGNRHTAAAGGDQWGANLRYQNYSANSLNQYSQRTVPPYVDVQGSATNTATVTVNNQATYRKSDYFRSELSVSNAAGPVWQGITNIAVIPQGTNVDILTNITGNVLLPPATQTFSHDADGNLTNDGVWSYVWDAENRLIRMEALSTVPVGSRKKLMFGYDYLSRRVSKVVSNWNGSAWGLTADRKYFYDGHLVIAETLGDYSQWRHYMWGLDLSGTREGAGGVGGMLIELDYPNGLRHFPVYDGNGNVMGLMRGDNGDYNSQFEYGPFGESLRETETLSKRNRMRFSTKYQDEETELYYYGYRYYNASTGRWLSRDPINEFGGWNLSCFVHNRPLSTFDPLGLLTPEEIAIIQAEMAGTSQLIEQQARRITELNNEIRFYKDAANQSNGADIRGVCTTIYNALRAELANASAELRRLQARLAELRNLLTKAGVGAGAAAGVAATGLYATAKGVFTAPTVGASLTSFGATGAAIATGAVVGSAVVGGAVGYGASRLPVYGGGNVADFYGNLIYDFCPSCFK